MLELVPTLTPVYGPKCCAHKQGIRGYGNPSARVVFLGIAPGAKEIQAGRPFLGPAGRLLNKSLEAVGLARSDMYCTNCLCWWNNAPSSDELAVCAPRMYAELADCRSRGMKLLITVGDIPTQHIVGRHIKECRGFVLWNARLQCYVMPMYHPSAVLHGSTEIAYDIIRDLGKVQRIVDKWDPNGREGHVDWREAYDAADVERYLTVSSMFSYTVDIDIETGTVDEDDPHGASQMVCLALSHDGYSSLVVPFDIAKEVDWNEYATAENSSIRWAAHFGQFDVQGMRRHLGVNLTLSHDSGLASYSVDERTTGIHGLDRLAAEYCGGEFYKSATQAALARGGAARIDPKLLYERCAKDAAYSRRLLDVFSPMQQADDVLGLYNNILVPAQNMFADTQYEGMPVDKQKAGILLSDWTRRTAELEAQVVDMAHAVGWLGKYRTKRNAAADIREPFNPRSWQQLSKLLFAKEYFGLSGGPSTSRKVLERLEAEGAHPIIDVLLKMKRIGHMLRHYMEPLPRFLKEDGKLHAIVFIHGTETGRPSYRKPPLQTIPHYVEDELARIREIFSTEDDEHVIAELDYAQLDIWMAAAYSQDEALFRDLRSGDYHGAVAQRVFGIDKATTPADEWDHKRQAAKVITFGNMFGTQAPSLAGRIHTTVREAQQSLDNFFTEYSAYRDWLAATRRNARQLGYIPSISGRKRRFPLLVDAKQLNEAINSPIQGTESDYTLTSAIELHAWLKAAAATQHSLTNPGSPQYLGPKGYDSRILLLVHDSIVLHLSKRYHDEVLMQAKRIMETPRFPGFPSVPVDIKVGPNWYEAKKWTPSAQYILQA
jgi:uracil-DNA glycosylase family 4